MGLYKEDYLLQFHSQQYKFIRMDLGTGCVQLWIGSTEQQGEQCYEYGNNNNSFILDDILSTHPVSKRDHHKW